MVSARHLLFVGQEAAKEFILNQVRRRGYDITRSPFIVQLQRILRTQDVDSVLDIGANIGQYASSLRSAGFAGRIVSCEPQSSAYGRLASRAAKDPRWEAVPTAAGAEDSTMRINVAQNSYSSSFLPVARLQLDITPASRTVDTEEVSVTTVDALVERHDLDPSNLLLKVDAQGYEQYVLDGASRTLESVAALQLELSFAVLYEGQQLFDDTVGRLRDLGYSLHAVDPGYFHPETGQLLWCDGVFVRSG